MLHAAVVLHVAWELSVPWQCQMPLVGPAMLHMDWLSNCGCTDLLMLIAPFRYLIAAQVTASNLIQSGQTGQLPTSVQFKISDPSDVQPSVSCTC